MRAKKVPLTQSKNEWARARGDTNLRGTPLMYNAAVQARYQKELIDLVRQMTKETKEQLIKLFRGDTAQEFKEQQKEAAALDASISSDAKKITSALMGKFNQLFAYRSRKLAERMLKNTQQVSKSTLHVSLKQLSGGLSLKTSLIPKGMKDVIKASIEENVSLIKSIPQEYFTKITGTVMRSITKGIDLSAFTKQVQKYNGQTERRAKNLALDQTRKAFTTVNVQRMQALNVKKFEWVHSGGGQHPRKSHLIMDGHIFSFENLEREQAKLKVPAADRGLPGYPINCRCTMVPIITFDDGKAKV